MNFEYIILLVVCAMLCFVASLYYKVLFSTFLQFKRLFVALVPTFILFAVWDYIAIQRGHWYFNERYVTGLRMMTIPIEELLFFVVIPMLAVLTWEIICKVVNGLVAK
jgi:lycopene beta-cyclase